MDRDVYVEINDTITTNTIYINVWDPPATPRITSFNVDNQSNMLTIHGKNLNATWVIHIDGSIGCGSPNVISDQSITCMLPISQLQYDTKYAVDMTRERGGTTLTSNVVYATLLTHDNTSKSGSSSLAAIIAPSVLVPLAVLMLVAYCYHRKRMSGQKDQLFQHVELSGVSDQN